VCGKETASQGESLHPERLGAGELSLEKQLDRKVREAGDYFCRDNGRKRAGVRGFTVSAGKKFVKKVLTRKEDTPVADAHLRVAALK